MESNEFKSIFAEKRGIVEKDVGHHFMTSSSCQFFNKTDFKQHLFKVLRKRFLARICILDESF